MKSIYVKRSIQSHAIPKPVLRLTYNKEKPDKNLFFVFYNF